MGNDGRLRRLREWGVKECRFDYCECFLCCERVPGNEHCDHCLHLSLLGYERRWDAGLFLWEGDGRDNKTSTLCCLSIYTVQARAKNVETKLSHTGLTKERVLVWLLQGVEEGMSSKPLHPGSGVGV